MSTDRELLERAAKAAGYEIAWGDIDYIAGEPIDCTDLCDLVDEEGCRTPWSPLTDDGDALRLAVDLGIDVRVGQRNAVAWLNHDEFRVEVLGEDPCAATRRAIVRAAAAIGEQA